MSVIVMPDYVKGGFTTGRKVAMSQDIIMSKAFAWITWQNYGTVVRINSRMEPIWFRQIFDDPPGFYGANNQGRECVLSPDGDFLYVCGSAADSLGHFYKLNAATGETIWQRELSTTDFTTIAISSDELIYIHGANVIKQYNSSGSLLGSITLADVKGLACDSAGSIYAVTFPQVLSANIHKYNSSRVLQWRTRANTDAIAYLYSIAISPNDDIFVVGSALEMVPDSDDWHVIFKYNTSGALQASEHINTAATMDAGRWVTCDKLGNVFAVDSTGFLEKFNASLVSQWGNDDVYSPAFAQILCDAQNRIHWLGTYSGAKRSHGVRDKDGVLDVESNEKGHHNINGMVHCKELFTSHFTDQLNNYHVADMCCFQDDTIPQYSAIGTYTVDDVVWSDHLVLTSIWWESGTGIFRCLIAHDQYNSHDVYESLYWEQIGKAPPCQNANWDQYTDDNGAPFGGIGGSPQVYTVSFYGMLRVSDSGVSPYNGEYLLIRGPGVYGFFFGVQQDGGTRINFTIHNQLSDNDNEWLFFGTDIYESCLFKYSTASNDNEKLTNVASQNIITTPNAIAYAGVASMYPGRRQKWDSTTVWPLNKIVAWHGRFYACILVHSNIEPPNATYWTTL